MSSTARSGVAVVGLDGRASTARRLDGADLDVDVERDDLAHRVAQRAAPAVEPSSASGSRPNGDDAPPGLAAGARRGRATSPSERYDAAPRSIGASPPGGRRGPGRLQELLAGARPGRGRGLRTRSGSSTRTWVLGGQQVDEQLHVVDQHRGQRLHALDGVALGELVEDLGQLRVLLAQRRGRASRTSSVSSSSRHGGAHSPVGRLEGALVGDREGADLLDRRHPRTRPAAGAPRSAGRRRRCRRGRRTRRAARPGRPGRRPRRRAGGRRRRGRPRRRRRSSTGSRSPSPFTCGCSTERTGATTTLSGPVVGVGRRGAPAGAAPRAGGRRCRCAGTAARAAASPRPGSRRPRAGRAGRRARRPGPRPRARSR